VRRTVPAEAAYDAVQHSVGANVKRYEGPGGYLQGLLMNGLLASRQQRVEDSDLRWLRGLSTNGKLAPEFFARLAVGSVSELGFANWYVVNQLLYPQEYPSAQAAREEVPEFQVPIAGSKPIKAITIENFQKVCYGSAALVIGETALSSAAAVGHGQMPVLAAVLGGSISALIFASVGSLSRHLEEYLKSKTGLAEAPTSRSSKARRASAA